MSLFPSSASGLVRIGLVASLGVNLFFLGWLAGGVVGPDRGRPGPPPPPLPPLHLMADRLRGSLSPGGMAKIEALIRELDDRFARRISDTEQSRARIKALLGEESFDPAGFVAALGEVHAETGRDRAEVDQRIADVIAQLSIDDRRKLAAVNVAFPPRGPAGPR
jgi:uncharacterized membrane protein